MCVFFALLNRNFVYAKTVCDVHCFHLENVCLAAASDEQRTRIRILIDSFISNAIAIEYYIYIVS